MDMGILLPGELSGVAARLDRYAVRLEVCATQVRTATATSWQGGAADLHRGRVADHAADLTSLASRVRESARLVRQLQAVAESRLDLVGEVDLTVGLLP